jgi:hypothetical protein
MNDHKKLPGYNVSDKIVVGVLRLLPFLGVNSVLLGVVGKLWLRLQLQN